MEVIYIENTWMQLETYEAWLFALAGTVDFKPCKKLWAAHSEKKLKLDKNILSSAWKGTYEVVGVILSESEIELIFVMNKNSVGVPNLFVFALLWNRSQLNRTLVV